MKFLARTVLVKNNEIEVAYRALDRCVFPWNRVFVFAVVGNCNITVGFWHESALLG
jgi:hypothetical protein